MSALLEIDKPFAQDQPNQSVGALRVPAHWEQYEGFLRARGTCLRSLRLTFDREWLEFMSISSLHDKLRYLLARIFDTLTEELNIDVMGLGETTIRRRDLQRGFEPDAWYYVQNAARMASVKRELDFEIDPPPDLAIEIEVTRSMIDRLGIYAAMGVREVWRCDINSVRVFVLADDGRYSEVQSSAAIPSLSVEVLNQLLLGGLDQPPTKYFREVRVWIRDNLIK